MLEVARRHHQLCLLGEAYDVVDLGGVPLEEEEAYEVDEAVDLDRIPLEFFLFNGCIRL